jgi:hypothetical protein
MINQLNSTQLNSTQILLASIEHIKEFGCPSHAHVSSNKKHNKRHNTMIMSFYVSLEAGGVGFSCLEHLWSAALR